MKGKIVGGYCFTSKKSGAEWCNIYIEVPAPENAVGVCVEKLMCSSDRLPEPLTKMVGFEYHISTQNNFISDFFKIPSGVK